MRSCAEIARMEGITRARVSQLWPLCRITREQAEQALMASTRREISLRSLIKFVHSVDVKLVVSGCGNTAPGVTKWPPPTNAD